ncbi:MAG TPA: hypothetical protein VFR28_11050, partial [Allosphingosinicella sp.]|nr:hypothetical protein [Allosphingosinicella sp.]
MKKFALKASAACLLSLPLAAPAFAQDMPVNGNILFSTPNLSTYVRDTRLSDSVGGLRFYAAPSLTGSPDGAALQFWGNQNPHFPGQAYIDSGAHNGAAIILRTAPAGAEIAERFRISAQGNVGIGNLPNPQERLDMIGNIRIRGAGNGVIFPDGTKLTSSAGGLNMNGNRVTNVGNPVDAGDVTNKAYTDANFVKFVPGAEQLSVGDANGTAPMINLRGGSTCCSGPGGHTPAWFKVFQNGSFVATGNLGIGVSPMQGKGYRTSWDSYKGAFRSGYADNEWDDANV